MTLTESAEFLEQIARNMRSGFWSPCSDVVVLACDEETDVMTICDFAKVSGHGGNSADLIRRAAEIVRGDA